MQTFEKALDFLYEHGYLDVESTDMQLLAYIYQKDIQKVIKAAGVRINEQNQEGQTKTYFVSRYGP